MSCTNCIQTTASVTGFVPSNCTSTSICGTDSSCIIYTGPPLSCASIATNDNLQTILQKIDPLLCATTGDYSTYNTYCLSPIVTQKEFVESISSFVCDLRTEFDTFTGTTFPAYQTTVDSRFDAIEVPGITCSSASVISTDTLITVLNKYCTKFGTIDSLLDVSGANWNSCYVVSPLPSTPLAGFNTIISQICTLKTQVESAAVLPTFNNTGSCLDSPGVSDTLVDTIDKIKTRLCLTGTLDTSSLSWGCITQPSGDQNLQDALQNILTKVTAIAQNLPLSWSGDFSVANVDNGDLCLGKSIALSTPSTQDRFVASTSSDLSPGVLQDKLIPGTNISLDFISSPGYVVINSSAGVGTGDHKVAVDSSDTSPDYLGAKISSGGLTNGLQIIPSTDSVNEVVNLNISVNLITLFQALIDTLSTDSGLYDSFCSAVAGCPSPCDSPTNVQVTYTSGGTTTTTTTTSTTTTTTTTP